MNRSIKIFPTPQDLAESFASDLAKSINKAAEKNEYITVALSGGSTPRLSFSLLAEKYSQSVDWNYVHLFWVDERCVPPDDPESNFGMTNRFLLSRIKIPKKNIHRIRGEADPVKEAERYSAEIMKYTLQKNHLPSFNIMILGMGDDGHTASIFPGNTKLFSVKKFCDTAVHPVSGQRRITLTGKVINNAGEIFILVTGGKKAKIMNEIFSKNENSAMFPAAHINSNNGSTNWLLDEEAANNFK